MTKLFTCLAALTLGFGLTGGAAVAGEPLPAYKLSVGQKLVYSTSAQSKKAKTDNEVTVSSTWNLFVASGDKVRGWRLIGERATVWRRDTAGEAETPLHEDSALVSFELSPIGQITWKGTLSFGLDPGDLFPRLPSSDAQARKGWSFADAASDTEHSYRLAPSSDPAAGEWIFRENRSNPTSLVVGHDRRTDFHFDLARGLVDRSEETDPSDPDSAVTVTKLESATAGKPEEIARLAADYDRYVAADAEVNPLNDRAQKNPQETLTLWAEAEEVLKRARAETESPLIQDTIDRQLARHSRNPAAVVERAKNHAALLQQPPVEWEATDLKGHKHSLAQYRGKVVILDFWYRGCGWCIRAMPQIKQVAAQFEGQPVVVLGMNIDPDVADADFVVDTLKLPYPNLRAEKIPQQYKVHGYPTLIVIDREGKVHDVHYGYSQTLKDELAQSIKSLLR